MKKEMEIIETMRAWGNGAPVWSHEEILERWGLEFLMYRTAWNSPDNDWSNRTKTFTAMMYDLRTQAINQFGFSIPSKELLDALEQHQPILEVGAGSGYMTALMRHRNIDVVGTDSGHGHHMITLKRWDPNQVEMTAKRAVRHFGPHRNLFCSWPSLQETWFLQALRAMRVGQRAIIVEEDACAEETTWDYRDAAFDPEQNIEVPAWPMLNDRAAVWIKRREHE